MNQFDVAGRVLLLFVDNLSLISAFGRQLPFINGIVDKTIIRYRFNMTNNIYESPVE